MVNSSIPFRYALFIAFLLHAVVFWGLEWLWAGMENPVHSKIIVVLVHKNSGVTGSNIMQDGGAQTANGKQKRGALPQAVLSSPEVEFAGIFDVGGNISKLSMDLSRLWDRYSRQPRRRAVSAGTKNSRYSDYLTRWQQRVEQVGNVNYPVEARRRKLYGALILEATVLADGSLRSARVVLSSGSTILDMAALRIVKLAAPFEPFPVELRKDVDILQITRTWQFVRGSRLKTVE